MPAAGEAAVSWSGQPYGRTQVGGLSRGATMSVSDPRQPAHGGPAGPAPFSALLREFRSRAGLSQNALARRAEIDPAYINRLESGARAVGCRMGLARRGRRRRVGADRRPTWSHPLTARRCVCDHTVVRPRTPRPHQLRA